MVVPRMLLYIAITGILMNHTIPIAQAQTAAGLVLEIDGSSDPTLSAYTEIESPGRYALGPKTLLTFVHYETCNLVVVLGGTLVVEKDKFDVSDGTIESKTRQQCPLQTLPSIEGAAGGIVLRSSPIVQPPTVQPSFVLFGPRANNFIVAQVLLGQDKFVEMAVNRKRANWPPGVPALNTGEDYIMRLLPAEYGGDLVTFEFTADETFVIVYVE